MFAYRVSRTGTLLGAYSHNFGSYQVTPLDMDVDGQGNAVFLFQQQTTINRRPASFYPLLFFANYTLQWALNSTSLYCTMDAVHRVVYLPETATTTRIDVVGYNGSSSGAITLSATAALLLQPSSVNYPSLLYSFVPPGPVGGASGALMVSAINSYPVYKVDVSSGVVSVVTAWPLLDSDGLSGVAADALITCRLTSEQAFVVCSGVHTAAYNTSAGFVVRSNHLTTPQPNHSHSTSLRMPTPGLAFRLPLSVLCCSPSVSQTEQFQVAFASVVSTGEIFVEYGQFENGGSWFGTFALDPQGALWAGRNEGLVSWPSVYTVRQPPRLLSNSSSSSSSSAPQLPKLSSTVSTSPTASTTSTYSTTSAASLRGSSSATITSTAAATTSTSITSLSPTTSTFTTSSTLTVTSAAVTSPALTSVPPISSSAAVNSAAPTSIQSISSSAALTSAARTSIQSVSSSAGVTSPTFTSTPPIPSTAGVTSLVLTSTPLTPSSAGVTSPTLTSTPPTAFSAGVTSPTFTSNPLTSPSAAVPSPTLTSAPSISPSVAATSPVLTSIPPSSTGIGAVVPPVVDSGSSSSTPVGAIVGGVVGGVVGLAMCCCVLFVCLWTRRREKPTAAAASSTPSRSSRAGDEEAAFASESEMASMPPRAPTPQSSLSPPASTIRLHPRLTTADDRLS